MNGLTATVIVVTLDRPIQLRRCLDALGEQCRLPDQVIVVDASSDEESRAVADRHGALYVRHERGAGHMTLSRNIGLLLAVGDIVAFVDDDTVAETRWLEETLGCLRQRSGGRRRPRAQPSIRREREICRADRHAWTERGTDRSI